MNINTKFSRKEFTKDFMKVFIQPYIVFIILHYLSKLQLPIINRLGVCEYYYFIFIAFAGIGILLFSYIQVLKNNSSGILCAFVLHILSLILFWVILRVSGVIIYMKDLLEFISIFSGIYIYKIVSIIHSYVNRKKEKEN